MGPQMIEGPQMIPDRKLSPNWTANDPTPEIISDGDPSDPNWLLFVTFFTLRCYEWHLHKRN